MHDGTMIVNVKNVPADYEQHAYMVATLVDGELWYYASYDERSEAERCAHNYDNKIVLKAEAAE